MNWQEQQAVVTGGSGFLGRYLIEALQECGCHRVVSLSRRGNAELEQLGVTVVRGDIRDVTAVRRACAGATVVFHTAAKAGVWGDYREYYDINVTGTANVLQACREQGIGRLVYTSSPSVAYPPTHDIAGADE
ncbi:MAG: NAD-dependent epimerase/dehydratase family protein, partial [Victivallales bacterium]|nr:NAD-dependent epimerase/dehydratase family protein [Victivallales bacterium]